MVRFKLKKFLELAGKSCFLKNINCHIIDVKHNMIFFAVVMCMMPVSPYTYRPLIELMEHLPFQMDMFSIGCSNCKLHIYSDYNYRYVNK